MELYWRALREGRIRAAEAEPAPCLADLGLLRPSVTDPGLLEPVSPDLALRRLLTCSADRVAAERRREVRLAETFEPLLRASRPPSAAASTPGIAVLSDKDHIGRTIADVMADATEVL